MIHAIQQAYYLEARNPSDTATLVDLAEEIGLDRKLFYAELSGAAVQDQLKQEVAFARKAPINGFPSLVLRIPTGLCPVILDYRDAAPMLKQIEAALMMIDSSVSD